MHIHHNLVKNESYPNNSTNPFTQNTTRRYVIINSIIVHYGKVIFFPTMDQLWFPPSYKIQEKITKPFIPFTHTVQTEREEITQKKNKDKQLATSV